MAPDNHNEKLFRMLMNSFHSEVEERLGNMERLLVRLEAAGAAADQDLLQTLYREFHSVKGASRTVGFDKVQAVCQNAESLLSAIRAGTLPLMPAHAALFLEAIDLIKALIPISGYAGPEPGPQAAADLADRLAQALAAGLPPAANDSVPVAAAPPAESSSLPPLPEVPAAAAIPVLGNGETETVRIQWQRLETLLRTSQDLVSAKAASGHGAARLEGLKASVQKCRQWHRGLPTSGGVLTPRQASTLANLADELATLETELGGATQFFQQNHRDLNKVAATLSGELREALLLPCSYLLDPVPRIVRDLAAQLGKNALVECSGGDVGIDRRVLEMLRVPLIHLLSNAVDHGIELPEVRRRSGKPEQGRLTVAVRQLNRNLVELVVRDDGAGIDAAGLRQRALEKGMVTAVELEAMADEEAIDLIFRSDISTAAMITGISGRGLGMGIVRNAVEKIGGTVKVLTVPGKETVFELRLPLAIASIQGIEVRAGGRCFVIPKNDIGSVVLGRSSEIRLSGGQRILVVDQAPVPVAVLAEALGLAVEPANPQVRHPVLILSLPSGRRLALVVDEIGSELDVVVRDMGSLLRRVPNIVGLATLGSGELAPLLNVAELARTLRERGPLAGRPQPKPKPRLKILVVDDSLTSRTLLRDILLASGYEVSTAVDGQEAFEFLQKQAVDAVVADVEMPRMNGFELTMKIREKWAKLPVILVTSLEKPEHRRHGMEAGADAYIVKRGFDQVNLLDSLKKLI